MGFLDSLLDGLEIASHVANELSKDKPGDVAGWISSMQAAGASYANLKKREKDGILTVKGKALDADGNCIEKETWQFEINMGIKRFMNGVGGEMADLLALFEDEDGKEQDEKIYDLTEAGDEDEDEDFDDDDDDDEDEDFDEDEEEEEDEDEDFDDDDEEEGDDDFEDDDEEETNVSDVLFMLSKDYKETGPFTGDQIDNMLENGLITDDYYVCMVGINDYRQIRDLLSEASTTHAGDENKDDGEENMFCTNCGTALQGNANFCAKCGKPVQR